MTIIACKLHIWCSYKFSHRVLATAAMAFPSYDLGSDPEDPPPAGGVQRDPLSALKEKIIREQIDLGQYLWQAASSGATRTLELVLQLPNGMWGGGGIYGVG